MKPNTTIAIVLSSMFLGLGIAAAAGASGDSIGVIAILGFFVALGLVTRLERASD